jgi:hypothetical protein
MKKCVSLLLVFFLSIEFVAQNWVDKMQKTDGNFYEIKADFEAYWAGKDETEKGKGYKVFKRWENFVERRVYPSGDLSLLNLTAKNYQDFLANYTPSNPPLNNGGGKGIGGNNQIASATFTAMGPFGAMAGNAGGQFLKSGRLNFVTLHPAGSNTLWVGAPAGGLWKSTDGGTNWTTNTDQLSVNGCSDLAIDPTNYNIMYLATGDGNAGDTRSIGVLKSINGGATWSVTGLTNPVTNNFLIRRLIINPTNTQILLAATTAGIYRTANGGTSWTLVSSGTAHDLEFKPGNSNVVYAGGTSFRLSTDGGLTFTVINSGIPTTGVNRMAVAVTPHDANYVYVLASNSSNSGFQGFYRSTNSGATFSLMASTPNLLGWSNTGNDVGGQGWYDLCTAASPLNKDEVVVGGVNVWRSTNGGSTWSLYGHWVGSGAPFTHADHHDLEYDNAGNLFNANDGTVYKRVGASWQEISGLMNISQIYKFGLSTLTANKWISGHQDNGTSIWTGTSYNAELGGDGMDCFFDRTNDNNVFGEYQNGSLQRSTNAGLNWSAATTGLSGTSPWVTIWKQDPVAANVLYVGRTDLFKSTNLAVSWSTLTPIPAAGTIREFAIAPSNNQIIYVLKSNGIYKTTDGGGTWSNVTGTVPVASALPEFICIDPTDANNAWVVLGGYSNGNKVFVTTNGGTTWTNYTANLPNIPGNCLIYQPGTNDRIYVGMDVGVYYRDNGHANWTLYNLGLPNVPVSDFEISPASPTLLHVSTYGRGIWVADLFSSAPLPVSAFSVTSASKCENTPIQFTDLSSNSPTAWSWSVNPSSGVVFNSSGIQNPLITFPIGGLYTVSAVASNSNGAGSTFTQVVSITSNPNLSILNNNQGICIGNSVTFMASGAASYTWSNSGGNQSAATFTPAATSTYTVFAANGSCLSSKVCTVNVYPLPVIAISGQNAICSGSSLLLLANGAATYSWSTNATGQTLNASPLVNTVYTVTGSSTHGCLSSATHSVSVHPLPAVNISGPSAVCAGNAITLNASGAFSYTWSTGQINSSISVSPTQNTSYSLTGMDANGCVNTSSYPVTAHPLPNVTLPNNQLLVCVGNQISILASGALTYVWQPAGTPMNPYVFTPVSSGNFTCVGTDANNCSASAVVFVEVTECVGINTQSANTSIKVFPNPNKGIVNIEWETGTSDEVEAKVYDAAGKLVLQKSLNFNQNKQQQLNIQHLSAGTYFINLKAENWEEKIKVLKED